MFNKTRLFQQLKFKKNIEFLATDEAALRKK